MTVQTAAAGEVILDAAHVAAIDEEQVRPGHDDVRQSVVWRSGASYAGVMRLEPGAMLPTHSHHLMAHHVWVFEGVAHVHHHRLTAGSYCYIPPGTAHALLAGTEGCALFYLYAPPG